MAYGAFKEQPAELSNSTKKQTTAFKIYRTGFIMNVLNPKVSLFFIAFLPQFVKSDQNYSETKQMIVLGVLFALVGFITFTVFALLAAQLRRVLANPSFWKGIKWVKVTVLVLLSFYLLIP